MSVTPSSDPEKRLSSLLHDLRTPLNQIIGLSEMMIEIAEENGRHDLAIGLSTIREAGLDLNGLLQDRSTIASEPSKDYWPLVDAARAPIGRVLGFSELVLAEPPDAGLEEYRADLQSICAAARCFFDSARHSGLHIRLESARHWDTSAPTVPAGPRLSLNGGRILIVDDERLNLEVLIRRLQREGCHPSGTRSGVEALELLRRNQFDVVLLDIQMPGMNGIEVLQVLKGNPELRHLPVIMLSALTDVDRVARCIELGAEDYLPKPINAVLLRARLGACLEQKRYRDQEQAQAEELLRTSKLQSIGALAGGLAHDFNNMLTGVLGHLSLLRRRGSFSAEALVNINEAERGAVRAHELTRYLLTFSEGGAPIKERVKLGSLLRDTSDFALRGSHVHSKIDVARDLWELDADPNQLAQVVSNVILNASEASPEGAQICVGAHNTTSAPHLSAGDYVSITVQDFGVGIAPENLQRIFDPFFTTKKQSRGLGLAAAYSIVQRHGGHIDIESVLGKGATVTIYLPAVRTVSPVAAPESAPPPAPAPEPAKKKLRVLVMDDEETIRELVEMTLSLDGHEVVCTADGDAFLAAHAAAIVEGRRFDLAVLDLTIPGGMGGKEAIRRLRERDLDIRAIVSSGYSNDPVMAHCTEYGFNAVLPKPYMVNDLIRVVDEMAAT